MKRKKKKRSKNPVMKQKFNEGFNKGLEAGRLQTLEFFRERFEHLQERKGIGPKTLKIIMEELGEEYFVEVEK